ncbi:20486_t:CDS:2 [Dentiscutata erythropus]|uniref:20486_t:CDS:1 n=1 Tax=Dentiscutata erythropus TaxID=1348616 RepID=A0A9N9AMZ4_9GLOM|nr:20486_t:CDS:2 [Dentiscutata erythropus]
MKKLLKKESKSISKKIDNETEFKHDMPPLIISENFLNLSENASLLSSEKLLYWARRRIYRKKAFQPIVEQIEHVTEEVVATSEGEEWNVEKLSGLTGIKEDFEPSSMQVKQEDFSVIPVAVVESFEGRRCNLR